jgi:hypothetical protein
MRTQNLKRVIVDFKKLTPEILGLLVEKYPFGYDEEHIVRFKNAKGETVEAVEVISGDTKYLVKVSVKLAHSMENFDEADLEVVHTSEIETPEVPDDNFE